MTKRERVYQLLGALAGPTNGLSAKQKEACGIDPGVEVAAIDAKFFVVTALSELLVPDESWNEDLP